jgi:DNA-binding CsgD family transcriptional regulator
MKSEQLEQAVAIYRSLSRNRQIKNFDGEIDLSTYLLNTFHVGPYFFFIYYLPEQKMEFTHESVKTVLGLEPAEFGLPYVMENIHPEDAPHFLRFEQTLIPFLGKLPPEKLVKYKVRYDYRLKDVDGNYKRILHQLLTLQRDEEGAVIRTFGVFTDITHLKTDTSMQLDLIGLDGEPSFYNIQEDCSYSNFDSPLSDREKQVLTCMGDGMTSKEIAQTLAISPHTANNHRKNILEKTDSENSAQAIIKAINGGWI